MNAKARWDRMRKGVAGVLLSLGLSSLWGLAVGGCAADHRVSFAEFLRMEEAKRQPAGEEPGEGEPITVDIDRHLGPYRVGPSDVVDVTLTGVDETAPPRSFRVRVDRDGQIDLPIVGSIKVADQELEDVEETIRAAYVPAVYHERVVHVELAEADTTNVLVVGAVTEPGLIPLRRNQRNVLFAIVGAGGVSDVASGHATLRRIRRPEEDHTFDLRDPVQLRQAVSLDPLDHGDIVYVHAAQPNTVFVGGLVHRAGPQTYPPATEISILQALAAAGGVRSDIFPREGTLIRRVSDGTDVHVKLDLNRLALGQDPNIALAPGDILWVPETWDTRVEDFVNRNIFLRAGASVSYNVTGVEFMNRPSQQVGRFGALQQDISDPYGFLTRNSALQGIQSSVVP